MSIIQETKPAVSNYTQFEDCSEARTRRDNHFTIARMKSVMRRLAGLSSQDGATITGIQTTIHEARKKIEERTPEREPLHPFAPIRASLAAIGEQLPRGKSGKSDSIEKTAGRRVSNLLAAQAEIGIFFVRRISAQIEKEAHAYIDYETAIADQAYQAFLREGKTSAEYKACRKLPRRDAAQARAAIFESYAQAALDSLPRCNAQLINPDAEPGDLISEADAIQFCEEHDDWKWTPYTWQPGDSGQTFRVTKTALRNLKNEGIPDAVIDSLRELEAMKATGKILAPAIHRADFRAILQTKLSEEDLITYEPAILKHCRKAEKKLYSEDLEKLRKKLTDELSECLDQICNSFDYSTARVWAVETRQELEDKLKAWSANRAPKPEGSTLPPTLLDSSWELPHHSAPEFNPDAEGQWEEEEGVKPVGDSGTTSEPIAADSAAEIRAEISAEKTELHPLPETAQDGQFVPLEPISETAKPALSNDLPKTDLGMKSEFFPREIPADLRGNPRFAYVQSYLERGFAVLANYPVNKDGICTCHDRAACGKDAGKHPKGGPLNSTKDWPEAVTIWRKDGKANPGLAAGQVSGFIVLDFDGPEGVALYESWLASGWLPENTLTQRTGGGGWQVFVSYFPGLANVVKRVPGLDIKTDGGQAVVAPSVSWKGEYKWLNSAAPILEAHEELKAFLLTHCAPAKNSATTQAAPIEGEASPAIPPQSRFHKIYPKGQRTPSLFKVASALRGKCAADAEAILKEIRSRNAILPNPLPDCALVKIATSVCKRYRAEVAL